MSLSEINFFKFAKKQCRTLCRAEKFFSDAMSDTAPAATGATSVSNVENTDAVAALQVINDGATGKGNGFCAAP
jgi:hypothetical protein